jgi:hypothetical protein
MQGEVGGSLYYRDSASGGDVIPLAPGPAGSVLVSQGPGLSPIWLPGIPANDLIVVPFTFATLSPLIVTPLAVTQFVLAARIQITVPFDDRKATLALGTTSSPQEFLTTGESTPSRVGTYASDPDFLVSVAEDVILTISPAASTAGEGYVIIDLRNT